MAKSVDPDKMLLFVASDLGLHCLQRPICPNVFRVIRIAPRADNNARIKFNEKCLILNTAIHYADHFCDVLKI